MQVRSGVHTALSDDGGALLDERTGRWHQLTRPAAIAVHLLASEPPEEAVNRYAEWLPERAEYAALDLAAAEEALRTRGLLAEGRRRRWWL
ncbi:hypothetical protein [Streptomyces sp. SM12]|uniref:hypothetical protein n=1 Tax=Streptomyces sp. SM12 TaxID=1071602 RepID=UPI000CD4B72A|nr:hypothetical protein [Streptomyces sp. SM12]